MINNKNIIEDPTNIRDLLFPAIEGTRFIADNNPNLPEQIAEAYRNGYSDEMIAKQLGYTIYALGTVVGDFEIAERIEIHQAKLDVMVKEEEYLTDKMKGESLRSVPSEHVEGDFDRDLQNEMKVAQVSKLKVSTYADVIKALQIRIGRTVKAIERLEDRKDNVTSGSGGNAFTINIVQPEYVKVGIGSDG